MREWYGTKFCNMHRKVAYKPDTVKKLFFIYDLHIHVYANCLLHLWLYDGVVKYEIKNKKMRKKSWNHFLYLPLYTNFYLYIEIKLDKNE